MNDSKMQFAAFVGIDWANQQHAVCLAARDGSREETVVAQKPEALDEWAGQLRDRFGERPVAVCLEQSRGALIYALMKYSWLVLIPINPKQLAKYRQALVPSGAKHDPSDARLLCEFVRQHRDRLRAWRPDDVTTRAIRELAESRRKFVDLRTALGNQLRQQLRQCFPQALELAGAHVYGDRILKLLAKYPTLKELKRASPRTLSRMLPRRRATAEEKVDSRIAQIRQAIPLVTDPALILASKLAVETLVAQILGLNRAINHYDRKLATLMAKHADAPLFEVLPGAGVAMAPRLLAAFGADRERYAAAVEVQQLSGIAPITRHSGKKHTVCRRRACSTFLRQTFHEFAEHSLKTSGWALAYYRLLRSKGARHSAAVRALAFKWIRILFRCWKDRVLYDEQRHVQRLRQRNSPLLKYLAAGEAA